MTLIFLIRSRFFLQNPIWGPLCGRNPPCEHGTSGVIYSLNTSGKTCIKKTWLPCGDCYISSLLSILLNLFSRYKVAHIFFLAFDYLCTKFHFNQFKSSSMKTRQIDRQSYCKLHFSQMVRAIVFLLPMLSKINMPPSQYSTSTRKQYSFTLNWLTDRTRHKYAELSVLVL